MTTLKTIIILILVIGVGYWIHHEYRHDSGAQFHETVKQARAEYQRCSKLIKTTANGENENVPMEGPSQGGVAYVDGLKFAASTSSYYAYNRTQHRRVKCLAKQMGYDNFKTEKRRVGKNAPVSVFSMSFQAGEDSLGSYSSAQNTYTVYAD